MSATMLLVASSTRSGEAAIARHRAQSILSEGRFHTPRVPRPLHGALHAIGSALATPLHTIGHAFEEVLGALPFGHLGAIALLGALALLASVLLVGRSARRSLRGPAAGGRGSVARGATAGELESAADLAERSGMFEQALRLRFQAGLLRLSERGTITIAPSTSNAEISRSLSSSRFDALTRRFEEVAYGSTPAGAEDLDAARREWTLLLRERARSG